MNKNALSLAVVAVGLAACGSSAAPTGKSSTVPTSQTTHNVNSSLSSVSSKYGNILASSSGFVYYMFALDSPQKSACDSSCASVWPAVTSTTANVTVSGGVNKAMVTEITRTDGSKQIVYNGHPLYTYSGDSGPKLTNGEGVNSYGGYWYVINTAGNVVKTPISGSGGSTASTSSTGSGTASQYG